jgi:hypothetical protein
VRPRAVKLQQHRATERNRLTTNIKLNLGEIISPQRINMQTINAQGLKQIQDHLSDRHKRGREHFTNEMLQAWAEDVERSLRENNRAEFEILASDSISGHTELCRLSDDAYDIDFSFTQG